MKELIELQNKLRVGKDQAPSNNMYKYRKVDDILKAVKACEIPNIFIILSDELVERCGSVYTKGTATISNGEQSESASSYAKEGKLPGQSDPQISGSCSTYARKKALEGLLALDDGNDPDGNPLPKQTNKTTPPPKPKGKPTSTIQKSTLKDQIVKLEAIGSESANKAITAINTALGATNFYFDDAVHLINKCKGTIEKGNK